MDNCATAGCRPRKGRDGVRDPFADISATTLRKQGDFGKPKNAARS